MHVFIAMEHAFKIAHHLAPSEPFDIEVGHGQLLKSLDGHCHISEGDDRIGVIASALHLLNDGYVHLAVAILANGPFAHVIGKASNQELVAMHPVRFDPHGSIFITELWHSPAHVLVLMLIRLWLCEQQYQPSPKITCLGVHDALREAHILSEPCIAMA